MAGNDRMPRVVFARIGWMTAYDGPRPGDEKPIGGGSYNKKNMGDEAYNFHAVRGRLYGYFQPNMRSESINLGRIDRLGVQADSLERVLVVFVANHPELGGSLIVGWYQNATIWRNRLPSPGKPEPMGHFCVALVKDCVLLPPEKRKFPIPSRIKGGFGRSNVCYVLESGGNQKSGRWIKEALDYIDDYQGPNLLIEPEQSLKEDVEDLVQQEGSAGRGGQGFIRTAAERKAIEERSMNVATRYFERKHFKVTDVSKTRCYDLECRKGKQVLHVEVKGTTTAGEKILLTANEVTHAQKLQHACVLFILHGIALRGKKATGGTAAVHDPWRPDDFRLRPIAYIYRMGD